MCVMTRRQVPLLKLPAGKRTRKQKIIIMMVWVGGLGGSLQMDPSVSIMMPKNHATWLWPY